MFDDEALKFRITFLSNFVNTVKCISLNVCCDRVYLRCSYGAVFFANIFLRLFKTAVSALLKASKLEASFYIDFSRSNSRIITTRWCSTNIRETSKDDSRKSASKTIKNCRAKQFRLLKVAHRPSYSCCFRDLSKMLWAKEILCLRKENIMQIQNHYKWSELINEKVKRNKLLSPNQQGQLTYIYLPPYNSKRSKER